MYKTKDIIAIGKEIEALSDTVKEIEENDLIERKSTNSAEGEERVDRSMIDNKDLDISIFGYNITKMGNTAKNAIGILFIVIVVSSIVYGLKLLRKEEQVKYKNKNKNKKNKQKNI